MLFIIVFSCFLNILTYSYGSSDEIDIYGFLPVCPGYDKPVHVTESFLKKESFFIVQSKYPNGTLYRKRYYYSRAIDGIGADTFIDFKNKKTLIYLSGYLDTVGSPLSRFVFDAYSTEEYNLIAVDTQILSAFIFPRTARNIPQIGNITAHILNGLIQYGLKAENIELLGYSMGGMTAAFTGKHYYRLTGEKVSRITSLDPAGPCFRNSPPEMRISTEDAHFVQVIHSTGQSFGIPRAMGHVDFYINGGDYQYAIESKQPWCDDLCGHLLAVGHFYAMIKHPDRFIGMKCKSVEQARQHRCFENKPYETNIAGPKADKKKMGIYYVPVTEMPPFYRNDGFNLNYNPLLYNDAMNSEENFELSKSTKRIRGLRRGMITIGSLIG